MPKVATIIVKHINQALDFGYRQAAQNCVDELTAENIDIKNEVYKVFELEMFPRHQFYVHKWIDGKLAGYIWQYEI